MIDFGLVRPDEIQKTLAERLRRERLVQSMTQAELAARAGVNANTVSTLEAGGNVSFNKVIRVALTLGRQDELEALFKPKLETLDDIYRYEESGRRQRVREKEATYRSSSISRRKERGEQ